MELISNPVSKVSRPKQPAGGYCCLISGEEQKLLGELAPLRPSFQLALETAVRQGELLSLGWNQIDLKRQVAYLPETQNDDTRNAPPLYGRGCDF